MHANPSFLVDEYTCYARNMFSQFEKYFFGSATLEAGFLRIRRTYFVLYAQEGTLKIFLVHLAETKILQYLFFKEGIPTCSSRFLYIEIVAM
jgi:hypothetical protein